MQLLAIPFSPRAPTQVTSTGSNFASTSSSNVIVPHATSSNITYSNVHVSIDSPNSFLSQVTLEQENALLKGIIEKGVFKSIAGSKQFNEIWRKQGQHQHHEGVGFVHQYKSNGTPWELGQYPETKFIAQKEKYDPFSFEGTSGNNDHDPQSFDPMYMLIKNEEGQPITTYVGLT
jgi:hypothetical protein